MIIPLRKSLFLTTAFAFLASVSAWANANKYKYFNSEKGLVSDYAINIVQDNNGFLWIGTQDGLSRFDGLSFKNYPGKKDSISSIHISTSFKDSKGKVWFGLYNGNILLHEGGETKEIDLSQYTSSSINEITEDKEGNIWLVAQQGELVKIGPELSISLFKTNLEDKLLLTLSLDKYGTFIIGTHEGLYTGKLESGVINLKEAKDIPYTKIPCVYRQKETGNYWIGTEDEGLIEYVLDSTTQHYRTSRHFTTEEGLGTNNVQVVIEDYEKNLWIGSFGTGVCKISISPTGNSILNIKHFNNENGLDNLYIKDIFQDLEGNIWFATFGGGIVQISDEIFTHYFTSKELRSNNIKTLIKDRKGNFWLGTDQGLIRVNYNNPDQKIYNYPATDKFPILEINSLFEDIEGNIWIGTFKSGLFRLDIETGEIKEIKLQDDPLFSSVNAISGDNNGFVWVSTKGGAYRFGTTGAKIDYFTTLQGLLHNNVNTIYVDSKDRIWLAAHNNRVSYFANSQFNYLHGEVGSEVSKVNCITEDKDGVLWFGSDGKGVFRFDGKEVVQLTTDQGLYSNFCYDIIADAKGKIWIGHRDNISIYDTQTNSFSYYGRSEGLLHDKINTNAVYKDDEDNIWFATTRGAIRYNPKFEILTHRGPLTNIIAINVQNKNIEMKNNIKLPYEEYYMEFEFVGISFKNPDRVKYRWMLEGWDLDWSDESPFNTARYSKLPEGNYTFKVMSSIDDDWNKSNVASFNFRISVPWFRSPWFYAFSFIAIVLAIYAIVRYRTFRLEADKLQLEQVVQERTIEVVAQKEEIEKKSIEIAKNAKNITDSIKYAKRIQKAIFPTHSHIKKLLPDSFILFRSKGIVSGDFYWVEQKSDKVLFAAVDCTGHGVPGAFMSIVANNLLNQAVNEHGYTQPSQILDELNKGISETLHQTYEESTVKDGMDIAMCSLDYNKKILQFAGAYNPLYLVRDGKLEEIKGDKFPIGVFVGEELKKFANHEVQLKEGDVVYIFSDGFADQFGGPFGKKFKLSRFKELIVSVSKYPIDKQYEMIDQALTDWQGDLEQVDDIVVIGVKI